MITTTVPATHADLLERPLIAHLATIRSDGTPQSNPMWFMWRDGRILMTHTTTRHKYRQLQHEKRVAISICDDRDTYRYLEIRGVVERIDTDPGAAFYELLKARYGSAIQTVDAEERVIVVVKPIAFQTRASRSPHPPSSSVHTLSVHTRGESPSLATDHELRDDVESLTYAVKRQNLTVTEIVLPTSVHTVLRATRFHYLDWGRRGKPVIVFLHGGGLNAHTYDLVCLALRSDFDCVSLDQRGHGDSEWSPSLDYDTTTHAADVAAFVDHLGLDRFVLVGMSMGGQNAIRYAGEHSDRLEALVIIDTGPEMQGLGGQRIRDFMDQPTEADTIEEFVERTMAFNPRRDRRLLRRSLLHNLRVTPQGKWAWKWDPRPRKSADPQRIAERRARLWSDVARITCPTLVVRGADSDVFSGDNAALLTQRLRDARQVVIEGAGHTVQGDNPAALVREMRAFLAERGVAVAP